MENIGIMQHIRELLGKGKSSRDVIMMGYAPGTVYKVQRQLRSKGVLSRNQSTLPEKHVHLGGPVTLIEKDNAFWWHMETPISCPECRQPTVHWIICPECSRLIPDDCLCPDDSKSKDGYTLHELLQIVVH